MGTLFAIQINPPIGLDIEETINDNQFADVAGPARAKDLCTTFWARRRWTSQSVSHHVAPLTRSVEILQEKHIEVLMHAEEESHAVHDGHKVKNVEAVSPASEDEVSMDGPGTHSLRILSTHRPACRERNGQDTMPACSPKLWMYRERCSHKKDLTVQVLAVAPLPLPTPLCTVIENNNKKSG